MRNRLIVAFAAFLACVSNTDVMAAQARCDGCTFGGYMTLAQSLGNGVHYIYDLPNGRVRKYSVTSNPPEAIAVTTEQIYIDAWADYKAAVDANGGSEKHLVTIERDGLIGDLYFGGTSPSINAYGILAFPADRTAAGLALANGAASNASVLGPVAQSIVSVLLDAAALVASELELMVEVAWSDGSRTVFKMTRDTTNQATVEPGRSFDSAGHPLPDGGVQDEELMANYVGIMVFNGPNGEALLNQWLTLADLYGILILDESGNPPGGAPGTCRSRINEDGVLEVECLPF